MRITVGSASSIMEDDALAGAAVLPSFFCFFPIAMGTTFFLFFTPFRFVEGSNRSPGLRSMGDLESLIPQTQKELGAIIQKVPRYPHRILLRFLKRMPHKKRDNACTQVGIPAPRDPAVVAPSLPSLRVLHSLTLS